jgi:hypothetical protein
MAMVLPFLKRLARHALCGAALLTVANTAHAQQPDPTAELRARIERLEKQNEELLQALRQLQTGTNPALNVGSMDNAGSMDKVTPLGKQEVQKIVSDYLKERDEKKKADEAKTKQEEADKGFVVGKDLGLTARWTGHQPWLETKDRRPGFMSAGALSSTSWA